MSLHRSIEHSGASDFANAMTVGGGDGGEYITSSDSEPVQIGAGLFFGTYYANQGFFSFDTTAVGSTPASATLTLGVTFGTPGTDTGDFIVAVFDWGPSIASGDWRTSVQLAALTEVGRFTYADISPLGGGDTFDINIDPAGITLSGTTRLIIFPELEADPPTDPTGNQQFHVDGDGGTNPPVLTVDSAPADPPTVTAVSPVAGTADGGTSVTITGTSFVGVVDVFFGGDSAASFTVDSDTQITAVTPAHSHISVHVTVETATGTSPTSSADVFSFTGDPPPAPDPVTIRVIDIDGNPHTASGLTDGELPLAMCKSITRVPNAPKTAEIVFPKYAYTRDDVHLFADDSGTGDLHLIEVVRNNIVRFRGVAVVADSQSSDGEVTLHCQGLDWILGRRFLDGQRTNELTNPSFETGDETGWLDVGAVTTTVTTDDAVRGTYSLRQVSSTPLGDIYTSQIMSIHGTGVGTFVTIVFYFKIESITGHARMGDGISGNERVGLYVQATDGGPVLANNFYAIDEATPTGQWIRAKTTIAVPPLATWDIEVRLYSPPGSILWDDGQVVAMQSISTATITGNTYEPIDVSEIVGLILDHVQDPSVGKSDLHITLDATTVGVKQVKHIQWADHISWDDQMSEWLDRDDCFDYAIRNNLDGTNELAMLVPRAGTDRTGTVTLAYPGGNVASYEFTEDGGGTITDDTELDDDTGDGPDREEGHYADASLIGGLTLQSINAAPTKSEPSSLDPLAREKVKKARRPAQLIKATINGAALLSGTPYDEVLGIGDLVNVAFDAGWIAVSDTGRISQLTEYPSTDRRLEVTVAVTI